MHDLLFENQEALAEEDLRRYARELGLDLIRFEEDLVKGRYAGLPRGGCTQRGRGDADLLYQRRSPRGLEGDEGSGNLNELSARLKAAHAALGRLEQLSDDEWVPPHAQERMREFYENRIQRYTAGLEADGITEEYAENSAAWRPGRSGGRCRPGHVASPAARRSAVSWTIRRKTSSVSG